MERGGDAPGLVIQGSRIRALAQKWGVGRLLEPGAIRELLIKVSDEEGRSRTAREKSAGESAGERMT